MPRRAFALLPIVLALVATATRSPARAAPEDAERPWLTGIAFPTNLAWAADGTLYVTDKDTGDVRVVRDGELAPQPLLHLDVVPGGETGLLGIALAPGFPRDPWMYLYFSSAADQRNELVRVAVRGDRAGPVQPLLDLLPLNGIHNGGDLAFGADGTLFVTVGEAGNAANAQDPASLGGKVLRLRQDGSPAEDPLPGPAYSMGLRNSFGICVDPTTGDLWETENGPASDDEVNRIVAGGNYGWPDQLGPGGDPSRFVDPVVDHPRVIVPTGCAIWHGDLYYGAFDGAIRRVALPASAPARDEVVAGVGAGITDLAVGPDGALYVATTAGIDRFAAPPRGSRPSPATPPAPSRSGPLAATALAVAAVSAVALALIRRRRGSLRRPPAA